MGALVCVQVWAETKLAVSKAVEANSRILKFFIGRLMNLLHSTILCNHCQVSLFLWLPDCLGVVAGRFVLCPPSTNEQSRRFEPVKGVAASQRKSHFVLQIRKVQHGRVCDVRPICRGQIQILLQPEIRRRNDP